ncbi:MAG: sugar/nucleoside kinase (ribokinase family) [Phycisphaerales bacterium]|jgi:sugar/nucleoside kinase (ribokinase family)
MSLTVTGTICIDTIETPDGTVRENILGGSGSYFAASASLYTKTSLIAPVGDDFPQEFLDTLATFKGLDTTGLEIRKGSKTFRWGGKYHEDMDRRDSIFTDLNILGEAPAPVPESLKASEYLFLANMHPAAQADMRNQFPQAKLVVADTMDFWIDSARDDLTKTLGLVHGLVLNYDEAEQFTGTRNPVTAGKKLLEHGPRFVIVKKGEHGAIMVHQDGIAALPAFPAEKVVDPTGAGDTFAGGMMGYLARENPADPADFDTLRRAMAHGTVMASFTIETFSLERLSALTMEQINARYDEYAAMMHLK